MSNHYEDTIWKQITTNAYMEGEREVLWAIITKIQSESKSQHGRETYDGDIGCEQSLRRYNLKANHNPIVKCPIKEHVVSNHYEDTIWKQITTRWYHTPESPKLWAIITKIQSESKSQLRSKTGLPDLCCEQSLRRYNLKANHNGHARPVYSGSVVS